MFMCKLHIRNTSRLMAGLFAMQLFAGAFCMMTPAVHAKPVANMSSHEMSSHHITAANEHCATTASESPNAEHQQACAHCNQPDEVLQNAQLSVDSSLQFIAYVDMKWHETDLFQAGSLLNSLVPTGPPKSSSLIYTTTQRIRI